MRKIAFVFSLLVFAAYVHGQNRPYDSAPVGLYGYMLDFPVNIRSQSNTSSEIIGRLNLHDEIFVIDRMYIEQRIEGMLHPWYRIRFNEITGFVWGGYVALGTRYIIDINNDGINDYIYYRDGRREGRYGIDPLKDLFIYINNERLTINGNFNEEHYFGLFAFKQQNTTYLKFSLIPGADGILDTKVDIYTIEPNGKLNFIKRIYQTIGYVGANFDSDSLEEEKDPSFDY